MHTPGCCGGHDLAEKEGGGKATNLADEQTTICSICQCDFEDGEYVIVIRNCSHTFHVQVQIY